MKVLVHLDRGYENRLMLDFGRNLNRRTLDSLLLKEGPHQTVEALMGYARVTGLVRETEVSPEMASKAMSEADLTIDCARRQRV